jgi:hypothetical protein
MITINQQPDTLTPAYNRMTYHVSSNNTAQPNFKFVCDIYIDSTFIRREKRPKHPLFAACKFDVHRIVESFVTHTFDADLTYGANIRDNDWCKVQCKFGEEYGDSSTGVTVYPDLANSNSIFAFNGSINNDEFVDWDGDDYTLSSTGSMFMMTLPAKTSPFSEGVRGNTIIRNQNYFAYTFGVTDYIFDRLVIITYDENKNMIEEYQIENGISPASDSEKFTISPIGYNANLIDISKFVTGTPPIYTDSVKYAKIYTVNNSLVQTSESIWLKVIDRCSVYESFEIHWLDRLGAINTFVFDNMSTENDTIERNDYRVQQGTMGATSFTLSKADRGKQTFFTSSEKKINLKSDWITQNEYDWLKYINESPQAWIYRNGEYISINITNTSYESKKTVNGNLINLDLTIDFSNKNYRQRY